MIRYGPGTGAIVRRLEFGSMAKLERWRNSFDMISRCRNLGMIAEFEDQIDSRVSDPPSVEEMLEELARPRSLAPKPKSQESIPELVHN